MTIADVRSYIASLNLADLVYSGEMPDKVEKSIGCYPSKHTEAYRRSIGTPSTASYGMYYASFLVHWTESQRESEKAARALQKALEEARDVAAGEAQILFIMPLYADPVPLDTDDAGIYEFDIEAAIIYKI